MSLSAVRAYVRLGAILVVAVVAAVTGCMDRVTEHRVRGNAHFREGDYAGAIKEYDEGLSVRPGDAATLILKGNALYEMGKLDGARAAWQTAHDADPKAADAIRGLALVASKTNQLDDAARWFEGLLVLPGHQHDSATRVNLAKVYLAQGRPDLAEKQAVEAGHENGTDEQVLFTLGRVYLAQGKTDDARATFQHLVDVAPARASGFYGLALVAARKDDHAAAIAELQRALSKGVPDPQSIVKDPAFAVLRDDPGFIAVAPPARGDASTK